jgi:C-terminal processing protease CtpA/Prc
MKTINTYLAIIISIFMLIGCQKESRKVQNIETFGKLYGYARWFHPSDEAQEIDWDKFAILGAQKVENIKSDAELRDTLFHLFSPIIQGLQISVGEFKSPVDFNSLMPPDTLNNRVVAWQHYGVYLGDKSNVYKSHRTHRNTTDSYSFFIKSIIDASKIHGKEIKLTGYFKVQSSNTGSEARLFLLPVTGNQDPQYFERWVMKNGVTINSTKWEKLEVTAKISDDTKSITLGGVLKNDISLLSDNFSLAVKKGNKWEEISSAKLDFEKDKNESNLNSWHFIEDRNKIELIESNFNSRKFALKVEYTGKIFEEVPAFGECIHEPIGNNLYCVIPLALYDINGATYPKSNKRELLELKKIISEVKTTSDFNMYTNLASIVISWNIFQHFYPYFDVIGTNWETVLPETLEETYSNNDKPDFTRTLSKMVAKLEDGHGVVYGGEKMYYHPPIRTELIENKIVITAKNDSIFKTGDIIKKVDGIKAEKVLMEVEQLISGSPHLRKHRALNVFGSTFHSEIMNVSIERDGNELSIDVQNSSNGNIFFNRINNFQYKSIDIKELEPEIFYINLSNCTSANFTKHLDKLAKAKSVIYDYRWGGNLSLIELIPHLIDSTVNSAWWNIPQVVYPNRKDITFDKKNWSLPPQLPRFTSKSIIITAPCVVSSGETEMGIINHYNLATTVGEPTAGCNGNVNWIDLPCGYKVMWTGMKVLKHDGSQHHLIGFQPDYPIERTMEGIKNEKDEILEKAIEIAKNKNAP